jgi:hypothetical protein
MNVFGPAAIFCLGASRYAHCLSLLRFQKSGLKNLKLAFAVALSGFQSGGRHAFGNLEATPIVEDGIIYVPDWR